MVLDGALEGAVRLAGVGGADEARAAAADRRNVQADVLPDEKGGNWFPEEGAPAGLPGRGGGQAVLPGRGALASRGLGFWSPCILTALSPCMHKVKQL